jgi:hypothetical protein
MPEYDCNPIVLCTWSRGTLVYPMSEIVWRTSIFVTFEVHVKIYNMRYLVHGLHRFRRSQYVLGASMLPHAP